MVWLWLVLSLIGLTVCIAIASAVARRSFAATPDDEIWRQRQGKADWQNSENSLQSELTELTQAHQRIEELNLTVRQLQECLDESEDCIVDCAQRLTDLRKRRCGRLPVPENGSAQNGSYRLGPDFGPKCTGNTIVKGSHFRSIRASAFKSVGANASQNTCVPDDSDAVSVDQ